tara:strand:+ start:13541 stop:14710 length:1170 start_codon:yes stop_codon:yes gene_type:complete
MDIDDKKIKNNKNLPLPFFSYGFRPFFMLAAIQSIVSLIIWLSHLTTNSNIIPWQNASLWHGHEMVYGFAVAVIAGFLLTAAPKWTGTPHLKGTPLILLTLLWIGGRLSMLLTTDMPFLNSAIEITFIPALIIALAPPIIRTKNMRNVPLLLLLLTLFILNIFIHMHELGYYNYGNTVLLASVFIILQIIVIIGGRVMPMFTRNALFQKNIIVTNKSIPKVNICAIASIPLIFMLGVTLGFENYVTKGIIIISSMIHLVRLINWHGIKAYNIPIVWSLHVGYLWIIIGLLLLATEGMQPALHAFTAGVTGTFILAMMSRVSLGHTGRAIAASPLTAVSYVTLQISIILRLAAPYTESYQTYLTLSAVLWILTFTLFLMAYTRILISKDA